MNNKNKLTQSYEYCRKLTYKEAKNFYFSFLFLPKNLRSAIYTVYAFCRIADDIADAEDVEVAEKEKQFKEFDIMFDKCFDSKNIIEHDMFTALQYVINKYKLSRKNLYDIVLGVRSDLYKTEYDTFDELYGYCYKVASCVAFVCIELFVPENERTDELQKYGEFLGIALQLTNILRDIKEDEQKQRRYLPVEWLNKFRLSVDDYNAFIKNNNCVELLSLFEYIASTALKYYKDCNKYITPAQKKYLFTLEIIKNIYLQLLLEMRKDYSRLLTDRVSLGFLKKITIALKIKYFVMF